jgi:hypothetical protein
MAKSNGCLSSFETSCPLLESLNPPSHLDNTYRGSGDDAVSDLFDAHHDLCVQANEKIYECLNEQGNIRAELSQCLAGSTSRDVIKDIQTINYQSDLRILRETQTAVCKETDSFPYDASSPEAIAVIRKIRELAQCPMIMKVKTAPGTEKIKTYNEVWQGRFFDSEDFKSKLEENTSIEYKKIDRTHQDKEEKNKWKRFKLW